MKAGYRIVTRGISYEFPSTVWVFNWHPDEVDNVLWDNSIHVTKEHPNLVAIFKIKPKTKKK